MLTFSCNFFKGFCKGEVRANMLCAINKFKLVGSSKALCI